MKISTNSWHFKLMETVQDGLPPQDLCGYVRALLFVIIFKIPIVLLSLFVLAVLYLAPLLVIPLAWMGLFKGVIVVVWILGVAMWLVTYLAAREAINEWWMEKRYGEDWRGLPKFQKKYQSYQQGIISKWWQDFKEKTCTMIQFED